MKFTTMPSKVSEDDTLELASPNSPNREAVKKKAEQEVKKIQQENKFKMLGGSFRVETIKKRRPEEPVPLRELYASYKGKLLYDGQ